MGYGAVGGAASCHVGPIGTGIGIVLVLFILLVIILRSWVY